MNTIKTHYFGLGLLFLLFMTGGIWASEPEAKSIRITLKPLSAVYQLDMSERRVGKPTIKF